MAAKIILLKPSSRLDGKSIAEAFRVRERFATNILPHLKLFFLSIVKLFKWLRSEPSRCEKKLEKLLKSFKYLLIELKIESESEWRLEVKNHRSGNSFNKLQEKTDKLLLFG
jgi:hypothetical protein